MLLLMQALLLGVTLLFASLLLALLSIRTRELDVAAIRVRSMTLILCVTKKERKKESDQYLQPTLENHLRTSVSMNEW